MTQIKLRRGTAAEWEVANPILALGEVGVELSATPEIGPKQKTGDGVRHWVDLPYSGGGGSGGGGGGARETVTKVTASLADQASENGVITMAPGYRLLKIDTDVSARVRLYATATQRNADASRPIGQDPSGNHGLTMEFISDTGLLSAVLSPAVDGYSLEATPSDDIPYRITNLSGGSTAVTVTLTWQKTE